MKIEDIIKHADKTDKLFLFVGFALIVMHTVIIAMKLLGFAFASVSIFSNMIGIAFGIISIIFILNSVKNKTKGK